MPKGSLLLLGACSALILASRPGRPAEAAALAITANIQARHLPFGTILVKPDTLDFPAMHCWKIECIWLHENGAERQVPGLDIGRDGEGGRLGGASGSTSQNKCGTGTKQ